MSKNLVIIRHGKSTWEYTSISDIDRPLKEIGISNTINVARELKARKIFPDYIISSPANRALHTAFITARELGFAEANILINPNIYGEDESKIREIIESTDDKYSSLFIFGHNPVFTLLPNLFLKQKIDNLPTSGAAVFEFNTDKWTEISKSLVKKEFCLFPKNL